MLAPVGCALVGRDDGAQRMTCEQGIAERTLSVAERWA